MTTQTSARPGPTPASRGTLGWLEREPDISVVIPMRNEAPNVAAVCAELREVMDADSRAFEVIIINDGSVDGTAAELQRAVLGDGRFTVIEFSRNFGQSAALNAGFDRARGRIVVSMDGDRQNDPHDIPRLVARLDEDAGYDLVSGWRQGRQDKWFSRRLPSVLANYMIRHLTWCRCIHDFGCTLKAYRRELLTGMRLYGEMHRFLPAICRWRGARLGELVVNHRPRVAGTSKYGLKRIFKVLFDLLTVKFLGDYLTKPIYFFGKLALLTCAASAAALALAIAQKFGYLTEHGAPVNLNNNVFILFSMMMFITTGMLLMMGVISELLIRIYHEGNNRPHYVVRRVMRGGTPLGRPGEPGVA